MAPIRKKIVLDDSMHPIAVQIDLADWVEIERRLELQCDEKDAGRVVDLNRFAGTVMWPEDGMEYQKRLRGESE